MCDRPCKPLKATKDTHYVTDKIPVDEEKVFFATATVLELNGAKSRCVSRS